MTHDPSSAVQRDADGRLRHLITLEGLSAAEIVGLLNLAQFYLREAGDIPARDQILWGRTVANLFFEPSTRTRVSFELAALRLGADVVNLDMQSSSRVKGETVLDTIYTLQAMHADILVMRDADGRLRHLITLEGLTAAEIIGLLNLAQFYLREAGDIPARDQILWGRTVANLFFEPSTRTRVSFELAALRLGADVVNLDMQSSSRVKGETVLDTIYTLQAMHADVLVMRDAEPGLPAYVAKFVAPHVSILNAGEAHLSHPTQGLLDALTVRQAKGDFAPLRVLIAGDISHSRVARSAWQAFTTLGVAELRIAAPDDLMPGPGEFAGAKRFTDIDRAIDGVDVVMTLRIQRERMRGAHMPDDASYHRAWGITAERMKLARPGAIVMHPGPMNRDVEIASEVADGPQSVIQRQVANGVAVRMAVLATIARNVQSRRHFQ
jgi:aspartate carbamoyltransferase catalytic subunit